MSNVIPPSEKLPTEFRRLSASIPAQIFHAKDSDYTVTVEIKNLNDSNVQFKCDFLNGLNQPLLNKPLDVTIGYQSSFKKQNILIKKGETLIVKTHTPGIAVRVYQGVFYTVPGQLNLEKLSSENIKVYLTHGEESIVVPRIDLPGVTCVAIKNTASQDSPAEFTITRGDTSVVGQIGFYAETPKFLTIVDVNLGLVQTPDDDEPTPDTDFDADLVKAYMGGRDSVYHP